MLCPKLRLFKTRRANDSGQSMVEFALVGSVFLLLVFGMFDLAYYFYGRVTLQNAVRQAARYAITGNCGGTSSGDCYGSGSGTTTPGDRVTTLITTVVNYSFGLVNCGNGDWSGTYCTSSPYVQITCAPASGSGSCNPDYQDGTNNAGGPGDTVTITATYTWSPWIITHFVPAGYFPSTVTYNVSSSFKNEPFPPAS